MNSIRKELEERKHCLIQHEKRILARLQKAPEGTLRVSRSKGKVQYYHRRMPSERKGKYIRKEDEFLARALAQKEYDIRMVGILRREMKAIESFLGTMPQEGFETVYESLTAARKELVVPETLTDEMFLQQWQQTGYRGKDFPDEYPELLTEKGERVRSKSEIIIADQLYRHRIPYRYECPLQLEGFGTVYPDFTILNIRKREQLFWEHMGMMDVPEYAEKAIRKIAAYQANGIFPGEKLILTYETGTNPINIRQVKEMILKYCE